MTASSATTRELRARLAELSIADEHRLRRRLDSVRGDQTRLPRIEREIGAAEARIQARRSAVPAIEYPAQLPVSARREDIAAAIAANQVVIIAGETGSGKTTQIPKICLELGRGIRGTIGHTQPRRLAARTVAERIAAELSTELGDVVGYTVRFTDQASDRTLVKLMTDGILLAEIQRDRLLRRYDTIIIDEAHERSLNIDFLLGYLKSLLPRRPDLKVIITSATIDPELFARHFSDADGDPAPIVEVSGRSYPVQIRYRPIGGHPNEEDEFDDSEPAVRTSTPTRRPGRDEQARDRTDAIGDAVGELLAEGDGDVLVFLSGEREIRDTADSLRDLKLPRTEIVPLYARLSAAEQHRVFQPHTGRRVVLATNVAETSLTVPGIRYVVDPGNARISRYSMRTKVQRLPIEPISQASARQRSGRCGRVADGICIRLYSEDDFDTRPAFTEPEILRTNLAAVILQMTALGLGDIESFPFVEPPDRRAIRDGIALLLELGALGPPEHTAAGSGRRRGRRRGSQTTGSGSGTTESTGIVTTDGAARLELTRVGRQMAQLPVDPRMARMLIAGEAGGCLSEVLVIVAALSIQDIRERPAEFQQAADAKHARFTVEGSDFLAYLRLWDYLRDRRTALSAGQFRRMCRTEFLHYLRIREWQDLHGQLRTITRDLGWTAAESIAPQHDPESLPWDGTAIHRALLAGMLSHIGVREAESREFLGARGTKFMIFPGSSLAKKPPRWVMAAELVETSRLWGRMAAHVEPEWAEQLAGELVKRNYSEPHWSIKRGAAMAYERVTLYGIPLVTQRRVDFGRIDPRQARELFIRHALVQGEWRTRHRFFHRNRELLDDVADLEHRARRRDILVDDQVLFDFYDQRIPAEVVSVRHFDSWWRRAERDDAALLDFSSDTVVNSRAAEPDPAAYPDTWRQGELSFALTYQFEPGQADDGVTLHIPIAQLAHVRAMGFDWLVPGMRAELATALIKTLPKPLRRSVVPAPDFAAAALARLSARAEPLRTGLARELSSLAATPIAPGDLDPAALPDHLRMTFAITGSDGSTIARGKNLAELRTRLAHQISESVSEATGAAERAPATVWTSETLGAVPRTIRREVGGQTITGYPALVGEGDGVAVRVLSSPAQQRAAMRLGTRTLLLRELPTALRAVTDGLSGSDRLALSQNPYGSLEALVEDCRACAADELIAAGGGPVYDPAEFTRLVERVRPQFPAAVATVLAMVVPILAAANKVRALLPVITDPQIADDVARQLDDLVFPGFVSEFGRTRLREIPRYLRAAEARLRSLPASADRDHRGTLELDQVHAAYTRLLDRLPEPRRTDRDVVEIWWMIQELRVGLFAQQLRTAYPVSAKRILKAIDAIAAAPPRTRAR
ncbi:MAG: ATP-dependent RNA helicase HrpA [Nocardia sp.]|nr:ATP-dependent RNA helicase HrpA [Nocardia sp.]